MTSFYKYSFLLDNENYKENISSASYPFKLNKKELKNKNLSSYEINELKIKNYIKKYNYKEVKNEPRNNLPIIQIYAFKYYYKINNNKIKIILIDHMTCKKFPVSKEDKIYIKKNNILN